MFWQIRITILRVDRPVLKDVIMSVRDDGKIGLVCRAVQEVAFPFPSAFVPILDPMFEQKVGDELLAVGFYSFTA